MIPCKKLLNSSANSAQGDGRT